MTQLVDGFAGDREAARPVPARLPRLGRRDAARAGAVLSGLVLVAGCWLVAVLRSAPDRLPDSAEVLSTRWEPTPASPRAGKAMVTLLLCRRDGRPISTNFVVFALAGRMTPGSSGSMSLFGPSIQAVPHADRPDQRELVLDLEMTPRRPEMCSCNLTLYNDAPDWQIEWSRKLPGFLRSRDAGLALRTWEVRLPSPPGAAIIHQQGR